MSEIFHHKTQRYHVNTLLSNTKWLNLSLSLSLSLSLWQCGAPKYATTVATYCLRRTTYPVSKYRSPYCHRWWYVQISTLFPSPKGRHCMRYPLTQIVAGERIGLQLKMNCRQKNEKCKDLKVLIYTIRNKKSQHDA